MSSEPGTNRPPWLLESTHPEMAEKLKAGLEEVVDPELGYNIIQLGLIRDCEYDESTGVTIKMILTTPFCPYGPAMLEMTQQKAKEAVQLPINLSLGMEMWDFSMMEEGLGGEWGLY